ncbi:hypothetical protein LCGC14_0486670, partial [marine sediment metagenome]
INARWVIESYRARLPDDETVRRVLIAANANHLIPILEQLMIEDKRIEHAKRNLRDAKQVYHRLGELKKSRQVTTDEE